MTNLGNLLNSSSRPQLMDTTATDHSKRKKRETEVMMSESVVHVRSEQQIKSNLWRQRRQSGKNASVLLCITVLQWCITQDPRERTKCSGGSERRGDLPTVVMVRWNSPANHLVLSNPIEPMLENWPITGHFSSPGKFSVCSDKSWQSKRRREI